GQIIVQDSNSPTQASINVTMAVNQLPQLLVPSQSALSFSMTANGQAPPSQNFMVSSQGSGTLAWTGHAQTVSNPLAPSANWLSITPPNGSVIGGQTGAVVEVSVNPAGLPVGQYYGSVNIAAPDAANNIQSVLVVLNVSAADTSGTPIGLSTGGL